MISQDRTWWEHIWKRLADQESLKIRELIAGHPHLPRTAFDVISRDDSPQVASALLINLHTPPEVLRQVVHHPVHRRHLDESHILYLVAHRQDLDAGLLMDLARQAEQWGTHLMVLKHRNVNPREMLDFVVDHHEQQLEQLLETLLDLFPYENSPALWHGLLEKHPLQPFLKYDWLPAGMLEWWLQRTLNLADFGMQKLDLQTLLAIARHRQASAQVFELLLGSQACLRLDRKWEHPLYRHIYHHWRSTPEQQQCIRERVGEQNH